VSTYSLDGFGRLLASIEAPSRAEEVRQDVARIAAEHVKTMQPGDWLKVEMNDDGTFVLTIPVPEKESE
jgi:hypothetical protein